LAVGGERLYTLKVMLGKLILLFTVGPLVELFLLIQIGTRIGALPTILIVLLTGVVGAFLAKLQGLHVWMEIQREMAQGRFPGDQLIDALLVLAAGLTLVTPGIITDILGFLILIPVTRLPVRNLLKAKLRRMMDSGQVHISGFMH